MRVQHNIMAMNAYRNLNVNNRSLSSNLEKLSSGYKINRAGDDAAGLAISEKMRAQITGLDAAQKNVNDAISMVKTTEGALQEVEDMMNRMVYLAEQSANGTYDDNIDRAALQDEVNSLATEINRIGTTANFNGKKVLNGDLTNIKFQIGDSADSADQLDMTEALGGSSDDPLNTFKFDDLFADEHKDGTVAADAETTALADLSDYASINKVTINIQDADEAQAAIALLKGDGTGNDQHALINTVSSFRAKLGAVQNRLEHTNNNLAVMEENIQDAESTIRDVDVADEMMKYTKNNILIQSAQAMLAQANQVPQGVLQLMQ